MDKIKIAVVEDNKQALNCTGRFLKNNFDNIDIECFYNPIMAYDSIIKNRHEIIITDNAMPEMDGMQLVEQVFRLYRPKTVLISSISKMSILQRSGLFDYILNKPLKFQDLKIILDKIIDEIENSQKPSVEETTDQVLSKVNIDVKKKLFFKDLIMNSILGLNEDESDMYEFLSERMQKNKDYLGRKVCNIVKEVSDEEVFKELGIKEKSTRKLGFIKKLAQIIMDKSTTEEFRRVGNDR